MKGKMKKQKRKIILKISAIMLAVFVIVSVVFSAITLTAEKQTQITNSHNDYNYLVNCTTSLGMPYNEMCKYLQVVKGHWRDIVTTELEEEEITCGADMGTYDNDMQITLFEFPIFYEDESAPMENKLIMDTDKEIYFSFRPDDYSEYTGDSGILNYDEFVSSMTQEELESICDYLNTEMDDDGYFYVLINKQCYYNPENGHVYPKTVEIVKAYEDSFGYGVAETIETYELNPKVTSELEFYESDHTNEPCIIDGKFVCNNFASDGLIDNPTEGLSLQFYDPDTGIIEKEGLFTFTCHESGTYTIETIDFEGSELALANYYEQRKLLEDAEVVGHDEEYGDILQLDNPTQYVIKNVGIRYAKRINLLECCGDTLIIGISVIFLFFLIIAVILIVMMCKMMKTQLNEEEKRSELTNAIAHDIKTPLFIISGYAQNLKENINTDKREHYCDRIINKTQEVNDMVHKMLELSRIDNFDKAIERENFDLAQMVKEITSSYDSLPDKKCFVINLSDNCTIYADKKLMHRAVSNLISNAVTYSDSENEIKIDVSNTALSISNKCSSISQSDIKHLTEPYYRVEKNRNSKGNGLGLSIVKSIADLHSHKLNIRLRNITITFTLSFS